MPQHIPDFKSLRKNGILDSACDQFNFRIDFFSMPDFCNVFMKKWADMLQVLSKSKTTFYRDRLNTTLGRNVNIDLVAEALNTTIGQISQSETYIFPNIFCKNEKEFIDGSGFTFFVNPYFLCIHGDNVEVDLLAFLACTFMYETIMSMWKENLVTPVDLSLRLHARKVFDSTAYEKGEGFGVGRNIPGPDFKSIRTSSKFEEGDMTCVVTNLLSLMNVEFREDIEQNRNNADSRMWENIISANSVYNINILQPDADFNDIYARLVDMCEDKIELICAR